MAFPSNTTLIDNFNRSNEDPPTGWTTATFNGNADRALAVVSNRLSPVAGFGFAGGYWDSSFSGADVDLYWTIPDHTGAHEFMARMSSPGSNGYSGYRIQIGTDRITPLRRPGAGNGTVIGSLIGSLTISSGDKIGVEIRGGVFTFYQNTGSGWNLLGSRTDSSPLNTGGGYYGFYVESATRLDDFSGGVAVTGTTYNDSASGTLALSGTRTESWSHQYNDSRSGTLALVGTRVESRSAADSVSGTIGLGGPVEKIYSDAPSGTLVLAGTCVNALVTSRTVAGIIGLSGTNFAFQYNDIPSSVIPLAGKTITPGYALAGTIVFKSRGSVAVSREGRVAKSQTGQVVKAL